MGNTSLAPPCSPGPRAQRRTARHPMSHPPTQARCSVPHRHAQQLPSAPARPPTCTSLATSTSPYLPAQERPTAHSESPPGFRSMMDAAVQGATAAQHARHRRAASALQGNTRTGSTAPPPRLPPAPTPTPSLLLGAPTGAGQPCLRLLAPAVGAQQAQHGGPLLPRVHFQAQGAAGQLVEHAVCREGCSSAGVGGVERGWVGGQARQEQRSLQMHVCCRKANLAQPRPVCGPPITLSSILQSPHHPFIQPPSPSSPSHPSPKPLPHLTAAAPGPYGFRVQI